MDGVLVQVGLPLVLAFMMVTMGLGLAPRDFARVATRPKAFAVGAVNQMLVLPLVTFAIASVSTLEPALAAGFMILAACPGGVTSNILTHYAKGDTALSIALTSVVSLVGFITIPLIVGFALTNFTGASQAIEPPTKLIAGSVFVLTIIPVAIGMGIRRGSATLAAALEPWFNRISALLFVLVVVGAVASNWTLFVTNVAELGIAVLGLNVSMMAVGYASAVLLKLEDKQAISISIETGLQNVTMGMFIGTTLLGSEAMSLPSAIYGVLMYGPAALFLFFLRARHGQPAAAAA